MNIFRHIPSKFRHYVLLTLNVFMVFIICSLSASAQKVDFRQLKIGEKTEREVIGQEFHVYGIELKRNQALKINFLEKGTNVRAGIVKGDFEQKVSALSDAGTGFMRESVTFIADRDDVYNLLVHCHQVMDFEATAKYELIASLENAASHKDIQRFQAEKLMEEASQFLVTSDVEKIQLGIAKLEESMKIWRILEDKYWQAIVKTVIGKIYIGLNNFSKAETNLNEALSLLDKVNNSSEIAEVYCGLAALNVFIKNEETARGYIDQAIQIYTKLGDKRSIKILNIVNQKNLTGLVNSGETGNLQNYEPELANARAKKDKVAEVSIWANIVFHYAIEDELFSDEERYAVFVRAEREALPLAKEIKDRNYEMQILLALGIGYLNTAGLSEKGEEGEKVDKERSLNYLSQALLISKALNDQFMEGFTYFVLSSYFDNDGLEILFGKKSINSIHNLRHTIKSFSNKEIEQTFGKQFEGFYEALASRLISNKRFQEALQIINFGRDQEFFDFNPSQNQNSAKLFLTPREVENERLLDEAVNKIITKYLESRKADYEVAANELKTVFIKLDQNFNTLSTEKDIVRNVPDAADMQETLHELYLKTGKKHAAIYFVDDINELILLTPDSIKAFRTTNSFFLFWENNRRFLTTGQINQDLLDFLEVLSTPNFDPRPLGAEIYKRIFRAKEVGINRETKTPASDTASKFLESEAKEYFDESTTLETELKRYKPEVLFWSLKGNIRYIPLAALYDARSGQYLAEKYENVVFTRSQKKRFLIEPKPWNKGLGFGASFGYKGFSPLPGVTKELLTIFGGEEKNPQGLFTGQIFLNRTFTRQTLMEIPKTNPSFVHIASHFSFQPGDAGNSFLLLGDGSKLSLLDIQQNLFLFDGVDLLTLSACETAMQKPDAKGKEIDGFAELAQRLGANSVIASLWRVSDNGTSKLMGEFYRLRQENPNAPKSQILRQAQLNLLNGKNLVEDNLKNPVSRRSEPVVQNKEKSKIPFKPSAEFPFEHPYYWAPFVLFGSSR